MTILRKSLMLALLFSLIGYGSAWAFEGHATSVEIHDSVALQADEQPVNQHSTDSMTCHCCHAYAHMLALCTQNDNQFNSNNISEFLLFSRNFSSYIITPDSRPPRV